MVLLCSKWYEVMPGDPWDDLQQQIAAGTVLGEWPAARDGWGEWSKKLETVFLVAIPSEEHRDAGRLVPGREDIYIIPESSCEPGMGSDTNWYYTNQNIKAMLILKAPVDGGSRVQPLDEESSLRLKCSSSYDQHGGMEQVRMEVEGTTRMSDKLDTTHGFPPRV